MSNQARHGLREAFLLQAFLQGGRPGEQGRARSQPVLKLLRPAALPVKGELPQAAPCGSHGHLRLLPASTNLVIDVQAAQVVALQHALQALYCIVHPSVEVY